MIIVDVFVCLVFKEPFNIAYSDFLNISFISIFVNVFYISYVHRPTTFNILKHIASNVNLFSKEKTAFFKRLTVYRTQCSIATKASKPGIPRKPETDDVMKLIGT